MLKRIIEFLGRIGEKEYQEFKKSYEKNPDKFNYYL